MLQRNYMCILCKLFTNRPVLQLQQTFLEREFDVLKSALRLATSRISSLV